MVEDGKVLILVLLAEVNVIKETKTSVAPAFFATKDRFVTAMQCTELAASVCSAHVSLQRTQKRLQ